MCGIAGWFSPEAIPAVRRSQLRRMVQAIAHRGPDGQGLRIEEHAALGHARLAIIDLERGDQPLSTREGDVTVVFNGEIYNYKELKRTLETEGRRFATNSDTEVILALYVEEGIAGFTRLRGMFAFALWDRRKQEGLLVRDPVGIKPLFVSEKPNGELIFGSEAKAILVRAAEGAVLDETSLHLLMNFRYLPADRTLFQGIRQLGPGMVLSWKPNGTVREQVLPSAPAGPNGSILDALRESVDLHLTADVEVAAYLSGGFDSAAIVALAKDLGHTELRTFTLDVGDDPNEANNAARTAALLGVANILDDSTLDVAEALPRLIWHLEVPKINALQVSELAKHAARHVKVALSGLGGDEVFLGYNVHRLLSMLAKLHRAVPTAVSRSVGKSAAAIVTSLPMATWSEPERTFRLLEHLGDWPRVYGILRNVWDDSALRRQIYGPRLLDSELPDAFLVLGNLWPKHSDPVVAASDYEWRHKMVNDLLWQEDRCSMAEGLEVRVPYLDARFAARVRALERTQLMPRGRRKGLMREMLGSTLPKEVLNRPKSGFQVNAPQFFQTHLARLADEVLSEDQVRTYGLFNPAFIRDIRARRRSGKLLRWHYFLLYLMLGTHLWVDLFEKQTPTANSGSAGSEDSLRVVV